MKVVASWFLTIFIAYSHGSTLPATTLLRAPSLDTYGIKSGHLGGNFAYSTFENQAYLPSYSFYSPSRPVLSPYLTYAFLPQGFGHNPILTSPIYPGQFASTPIFGGGFYPGQVISHPVFANPVGQPGLPAGIGGQVPFPGGQFPFPGGIGGVGGGVGGGGVQGDAPVIPPGQAAPTPVEGTLVDEDTVSVEAA